MSGLVARRIRVKSGWFVGRSMVGSAAAVGGGGGAAAAIFFLLLRRRFCA